MRAEIQQARDPLLAAAVATFAVLSLALELGEGATSSPPPAYIAVAVAGGAVWFMARNPVAALAVVTVARILVTVIAGNGLTLMPAAMVVLYGVARHGERRTNLVIATTAALVMMTVVAYRGDDTFVHELLGEAGQMLLPIAVADAARTRADRVRDLVDAEAEARVQAERIRIARDLHDIVAHSLSTIAVQSGVASHLLPNDPDQAKEALDIINATGRRSLQELRSMVGVLRSTDLHPLTPTPTDPDDLSELLMAAERAGLTVELNSRGHFPADIPDAPVIAFHRIVQEALTNVSRHAGPVAAIIDIVHGQDSVTVEVTNALSGEPVSSPASTGVGIIGMRERAETLGGSLRARTDTDGRFMVTAVLPYRTLGEGQA